MVSVITLGVTFKTYKDSLNILRVFTAFLIGIQKLGKVTLAHSAVTLLTIPPNRIRYTIGYTINRISPTLEIAEILKSLEKSQKFEFSLNTSVYPTLF